MNPFDKTEDPRRRLLIQALAAGMFSGGLPGGRALAADILGNTPSKLPPGQSIYRVSGPVTVNGAAANMKTRIGPSDTVETGKGGEIVFAVGESAFLLREGSRMVLASPRKDSMLISALRLVGGKLLSVFPKGKQPKSITTATATMGIRGTGVYLEADPQQTYFCTCYGVAEVVANKDPQSKETVVSTHHDKPLYIVADGKPGQNIRSAPFINHTDQELTLIETLVGRKPPFVFPKDGYKAPRRDY